MMGIQGSGLTTIERLRALVVKDLARGLITDDECVATLLALYRWDAEKQENKNARQSLVCVCGGDVLRRGDGPSVLSMELTQSLKEDLEGGGS